MLLGAFCVVCALIAPGQLAVTRAPIGPVSGEGGTSPVFRDGVQVGWYVDNEEPKQGELVAQHQAEGWTYVVAGIWPACEYHPEQSCGFPGAINAREFYPFGLGETIDQLPAAESYIVQWSFTWDGMPPPTKRQRWSLLCAARSRSPQVILLYQAEVVPTQSRLKRACR